MSTQILSNQSLKQIQKTIEEGPQPLYELFNNEAVGKILADVQLEYGPWLDRISKRSLRIKNVDKGQDLACVFGLDPKLFAEKYLQAISGDGQEARRIRTLHSSSLLCLLCFYGVSEERPLNLDLGGRQVRFTSSQFEVKNLVGTDETGREHESNMDVVLTGEDARTGERVILFLESKFSEYLTWGKYSGISNYVYGKTYTQLSNGGYLDRMGLKFEANPDNPGYSDLASMKGKTLHYAGGIKQMVSHSLGVKNVANSNWYKDSDIYLGEILYKFPESIDHAHGKFEDYDRLYKILAEGLNVQSDGKYKILGRCLTYQDVFKSFDLDNSVRGFYLL